ncbi:MAG: hypothetical protein UY20_C0002G0030 [Candidatus Yanofskybacteria bacterium GW2011_GWA1_48_10]|uniref:Uncharacterized protein n=3 Tax=Parcubacteria group TaxID=1794811 RepID=A0A0G1X6M2_9BACT|nr:MAG: hypothetical protein UY01_C0009G0004 [Candidatus Nomurabacteria bacterium GW2011_GWB1_47_6]KKU90050.1 MAG: hypothetical protein UY20_C0002G0030 [Candidatus Yanofskybacteria bacterium GW2011_GWA1_48_10]OGN05974.1 MAG: hypothetical protein A2669_01235 [Candidatus Yanofskybacteria bacterium RIFCSPHIGHO2_01_FULL_48_25b]
MANPLTRELESKMGMVFFALLALFLAGILFITIKNYDSDQIAINATATQVKSMTSTERQLIAVWIKDNNIELPEGKGYKFLTQKYPDRPWLKY